MPRLPRLGYALVGSLGSALLAGCTGGAVTPEAGSLGGAAASQSIVRGLDVDTSVVARHRALQLGLRATTLSDSAPIPGGGPAVAVSDDADDVVRVFDSTTGKLEAQLTGFSQPQGLGASQSGALYIADTGNSRIVIYPHFTGGVPKTLSDAGEFPSDVAVDANGNVGVTNTCSAPSCHRGGFTFYDSSGHKTRQFESTSIFRPFFGGFDSAGNFFADGLVSGGKSAVVEVIKGAHDAIALSGASIERPGGLNVDSAGDICIDDQYALTIDCYALSGTTLRIVSSTALPGSSDPVGFTFTANGLDVRVADASLGDEIQYKFPAGVQNGTIYVGGEPDGIANNPTFAP